MEMECSEIEYRTKLLFEMLEASHGLSHWVYDPKGMLLETNSESMALEAVFAAGGCKTQMLAQTESGGMPILMSIPLGLIWVAAFQYRDGALYRAYVMGPAFHTEISLRGIRMAIEAAKVPDFWKKDFAQLLRRVPAMSATSLRRAGVMLHKAITGESIGTVDITLGDVHTKLPESDPAERADRHRTWMAEQKLLNMVREGNLDYRDALEEAGTVSTGVRIRTDSPIAQVRTTQIVFISLCVRAAIDGGLMPDVAYSIGDSYIQRVNDCEDMAQMSRIGHSMYREFIQLVYASKRNSSLSKPIQGCCDYISLHLEDPIRLEEMARRMGYAEYYLSRKFRQETGQNLTDYIKDARIQRACLLLTTTDQPIPEIARRLQFSSRAYFSVVFKERMGVTPVEYRQKNQKT